MNGHFDEPPARGSALPAGRSGSIKNLSRAAHLLVECRVQRGWGDLYLQIR